MATQKNYDDAVNLILAHGIGRDDVPLEQALLDHGFLGCLRPFSGLREENFREVMRAIASLRPFLNGATSLDRRLVDGLWGLTTLARLWGLDPNGMLQRNHLLSVDDTARLLGWVQCIESAVFQLLHAGDLSESHSEHLREDGSLGLNVP